MKGGIRMAGRVQVVSGWRRSADWSDRSAVCAALRRSARQTGCQRLEADARGGPAEPGHALDAIYDRRPRFTRFSRRRYIFGTEPEAGVHAEIELDMAIFSNAYAQLQLRSAEDTAAALNEATVRLKRQEMINAGQIDLTSPWIRYTLQERTVYIHAEQRLRTADEPVEGVKDIHEHEHELSAEKRPDCFINTAVKSSSLPAAPLVQRLLLAHLHPLHHLHLAVKSFKHKH